MTVLNKQKFGIPAGAEYIGRGSVWGNPFVIGQHGDRAQVCDRYEALLVERLKRGEVTLPQLRSLHGRDLVCFCAPARCHGDTLALFSGLAQTTATVEELLRAAGK